VAKAAE